MTEKKKKQKKQAQATNTTDRGEVKFIKILFYLIFFF
jgi:hypothetical protein